MPRTRPKREVVALVFLQLNPRQTQVAPAGRASTARSSGSEERFSHVGLIHLADDLPAGVQGTHTLLGS